MAEEKKIWDYLLRKLGNPYGVAGLMGNLYVESKLEPTCLQSSYARKFGKTGAQYTKEVDEGTYTDFIHDSAGYGLAQWTYWSRKELLLNKAKEQNTSIGNLDFQLDYLWQELQLYKTVLATLKSAKSVREASDIVVERYEKPKNMSEEGKKNRADYGMVYFNRYYNKISSKKVVVTSDNVNIRSGNGKEFGRISIANTNNSYMWVATAENGWHAVKLPKQVGWISPDFSRIE